MIYEGDIEWRVEDGGQALVVDVVTDEMPGGVAVTLTSWVGEMPYRINRYDLGDVARVHPELATLITGKSRLRITVEAVD